MALSTLPNTIPAFGLLARIAPPLPIRSFLRATGYLPGPPQPLPHIPRIAPATNEVLASGRAEPRQRASLLCEIRPGDHPTIVLGGFVPDATEQVCLLRAMLLRHGSLYYVNYPPGGFSLDLLCAQIDDLVDELCRMRGQCPVILSISFGAGLLIEWLRRSPRNGAKIAGAVLVSPVACFEDIVDPSVPRPTTLVGRALKPFADEGRRAAVIGRARVLFTRIFEAGARNPSALAALLTAPELSVIRARVIASLGAIDAAGAFERVDALRTLRHPDAWRSRERPVLTHAPTLAVYAEKENSVIAASSPTRRILGDGAQGLFPKLTHRIASGGPTPVQHASLIFHHYQFYPLIAAFYRELKPRKFMMAA